MKQRWILGILGTLIAVFFLSCTGFFGQEEEINDLGGGGTSGGKSSSIVFFENNGNTCSVDVSASYLRDPIIVTVSAKQKSIDFNWEDAAYGFEFYFTYNLPISSLTIPYVHNKGFVTAVIQSGKKNEVKIASLSNIINSNDPLFSESIVVIKNLTSAIRLQSGSSGVTPVTGTDSTTSAGLIGANKSALYKIASSANVSNYSILLQGSSIPLSSVITSFQSGYLYEITVFESINTPLSLTNSPSLITRNSLGL